MKSNRLTPENLHADVTHKIIGAGMEVHRVLGRGFAESVYGVGLAREFTLRHIRFDAQVAVTVIYKDIVAGEFRADFLVEKVVVVEIKAISALTPADDAQILNYMRGLDVQVGLLLNFGTSSLEYKRRVLTI
jgi:GxxExxY protein